MLYILKLVKFVLTIISFKICKSDSIPESNSFALCKYKIQSTGTCDKALTIESSINHKKFKMNE